MLAPNLFKIKPPNSHISYSSTTDSADIKRNIDQHCFNHSVTAIIPDTLHVPSEIKNIFTHDLEYYVIKNCPLHMLIDSAFMEAFVNRGEIRMLSTNTFLDIDNCFALSHCGHLILSVHRNLFLKLGIDKGPAVNIISLKKDCKYVLIINIKHPCFKADKNNYKRVYTQLYNSGLSANFIVSWEPNEDEKICPSSVASYFHKKGLKVEECQISYSERRYYNMQVPNFQSDADELFEWLGLFLLGVPDFLENENYEYLSSYRIPEVSESVGQVLVIQATGLLSSKRINSIFESIRNYISLRSSIPWIALHIQGFEDSPISWNLLPHRYSVFGDNNYSVIFDNSGSTKSCKVVTSMKCRS